MHLRPSMLRWFFLAALFLAATLSSPGQVFAEPNSAEDQGKLLDPALVYPSASEVFSPRIYGSAQAPATVIMPIIPFNEIDEKLFVDLYPHLQPLVIAGKVRLEIRLWANLEPGLPFFIVAQCLDPATMPLYLYKAFVKEGPRFTTAMEAEKFAWQQALYDPQLVLPGLTKEQFRQRLNWCLTKKREGIIYSEASRHNSIFNWNLKNGGYGGSSVVVVNHKVFDGNIDVDEIMKSVTESAP